MADTRRLRVSVVVLVSSLVLAACSQGEPTADQAPSSSPPPSSREPAPTSPAPTTRTSDAPETTTMTTPPSDKPSSTPTQESPSKQQPRDPLAVRIDGMSLRDKARQLITVGFGGTTAPEDMLERMHPGGLIYFSENVASSDQIRAMSARAQEVSQRSGEPLLIMADQEGGLVTRLPDSEDVPGGSEFGGDARSARQTAKATGRELTDLGINVNLAPVSDVNTAGDGGVIGTRSFGSDPQVVSRLVRAQVCGYHAGEVATATKHFPGHGSTLTDSHQSTASVERSEADWRRLDLPPFAAAVDEDVDMILLGHLAFPSLDPSGKPATISPLLNRQLIRGELGYDGVVVTDALNMGGITSWGDTGEIAVASVKAGSDILLMPPRPAEAVRALVAAVEAGDLSEQRLDTSVERILELKQRLGLYAKPRSLPTC